MGQIDYKRDNSDFVTQVDEASEDAVREFIRERYPEHNILGEENGGTIDGENTWIVDPLDGTTNYFHGFPAYGCILSLIKDDELYLGIFLDSANDTLYYAVKGKGAYKDDERISVSQYELDESLVVFPLKDNTSEGEQHEFYDWLLDATHGTRKLRSGVFGDVQIAQGRLDGRVEWHTHPWDIAASIVIVREAGGRVTTIEGDETIDALLSDPVNIVISNGKIHDELQSKALEVQDKLK